MEDGYGLVGQGSGLWRSLRDGDFEEEDVWDVLRERKDSNSSLGKSIQYSVSVPRNLPSAARMIPRTIASGSSSNNSSHETKVVQQSAPVNVPDWSKICNKKSKKTSNNVNSRLSDAYDDGDDNYGDDDADGVETNDGDSDDEDGDDSVEYNNKVPPHEYIARRLARTQISSFSVFEGVGRTLKGRDLSRVRNAVLTKTGFLESP